MMPSSAPEGPPQAVKLQDLADEVRVLRKELKTSRQAPAPSLVCWLAGVGVIVALLVGNAIGGTAAWASSSQERSSAAQLERNLLQSRVAQLTRANEDLTRVLIERHRRAPEEDSDDEDAVEELEKKVKALKADWDLMEVKIAAAKEVALQRDELAAKADLLRGAAREKEELQQQLRILAEGATRGREEAARALADSEAHRAALAAEANRLATSLEEANREKGRLAQEAEALRGAAAAAPPPPPRPQGQELQQLRAKVNKLTRKNEDLETEFQAMETKRDELEKEINRLTRKNEDLETEFQAMETKRDELERDVEALESQRDKRAKASERLAEELRDREEELEKEVEALKQALESQRDERTKASERLFEEVRDREAELEKEVEVLKQALKAEKGEHALAAECLRDEIRDREQLEKDAAGKARELSDEVQASVKVIAELREQLKQRPATPEEYFAEAKEGEAKFLSSTMSPEIDQHLASSATAALGQAANMRDFTDAVAWDMYRFGNSTQRWSAVLGPCSLHRIAWNGDGLYKSRFGQLCFSAWYV